MSQPRTLRRRAALSLCVAAAAVLAASAAGGVVHQESVHDESTFVEEDFCDTAGLNATVESMLDLRVHIGPHGRDGLAYFLTHGSQYEVITANGKSLTSTANVTEKDHRITVNADGTLRILVLATGNAVLYGPNGKAIARNPGQLRYELLVDEQGTSDPSDDEITFLGVVRGSTGRSDDFCEAAVPALS